MKQLKNPLAIAAFAAILLLPVSTVHGQPGQEETATGRELLKREISLAQPLVEVNTSSFRVSLPGTLTKPAQWIETGWAISLDINTEEPVICAVHDTELDLSSSLKLVGDNIFSEASQARSGDLERRLLRTDAGAIGPYPFLATEWFLLEKSNGTGVVLSKHRAALVDGYSILCVHNEVGYRKTFEELFDKLVRGIVLSKPKKANNFFEQIQTVRINGSAVGFLRISVGIEGNHNLLTTESSSSFIPGAKLDQAISRDTKQITLATPDGVFLRGKLIVSGARQRTLSLDQNRDGGWELTESEGGKDKVTKVQIDQRPATFISSRRKIGAAMATPSRSPLTYLEWQPLNNPAALSSVAVTWPAPEDPTREALVNDGGVVGKVWFDRDGTTRLATATNNGVTIEIGRVHLKGRLD